MAKNKNHEYVVRLDAVLDAKFRKVCEDQGIPFIRFIRAAIKKLIEKSIQ